MISQETLAVARALSDGVKETPFVKRWKQHFDKEEWLLLAQLKANPCDYTDSETYWSDNLISSFLRKNGDLDAKSPKDLKREAVDKFFLSEHQCFQTNRRLYALRHNFSQENVDVAARVIMTRARKIIQSIVGRRPRPLENTSSEISEETPEYVTNGAHGPGATLSDPSTRCTAPDKFESVPTMTDGMWPLIVDWMSTSWAAAHIERCSVNPRRAVRVVKDDKFFTVPKTALVLRGCAKQPSINVFYQLALGRELRSKLRKYIDLDTAKERHGALARWASIFGLAATVDLERASDTLADEVVTCLWPGDWVRHLRMMRTISTALPDGRVVKLEKFSSMGNGYTFELESITFYALALAAAGYDTLDDVPFEEMRCFSVLGDDIICPTKHAREVCAVLQYFGFTLNSEKTFVYGPFRESCGFDCFRGTPVRGFFLENSIENPADILACLNGLRRTALAGGDVDVRWRAVAKAWHYLLGRLPRALRSLRGPESLGDVVIHAPEDTWRSRTANSIREFRAYRASLFTEWDLEQHWPESVMLASKLYGVSSQDPKGSGPTMIRPRGDPLAYRIVWVACS